MTAPIRIKVLGGFAVLRDGETVKMPPSKKTRALLAYLAVERKTHRRERLCELLWGIPDDPRGALRWSLSKLRQVLNVEGKPVLETDRDAVGLAEQQIELDYQSLRDLSLDSVEQLPTERLEALADVFTGPFLDDLYLPRCPEFEAWRTFHVTRTEMLQLKILQCLIERLKDAPERAVTHLLTLQTLMPDEDFSAQIQAARSKAQQSINEVEAARSTSDLPASDGTPSVATDAKGTQGVRYCRAPDGVRIAYAVDGSGPPIIRTAHWMSHIGLERRSPVWEHWLTTITRDFTLVRYDERLNGLSDQEADDVSFEAMVGDLESVVDAAVPDQRFILLGISQGCPLAIEYALRHPDRVAGLILHGGFVRGWRVRGDQSEVARREAMQVLIREGWGQNHPTFRQLFTSMFIPGADSEQAEWFNEVQRVTVTPDNAARLSEVFSRIDVSDDLTRLNVPTLVIHARQDQITPLREGQELAQRIANARMVELESENHILLGEEPAFLRFFEEVARFAREVLPGRPVPISNRRRYEATVLCAQIISPIQALGSVDPDAPLEMVDQLLIGAADLIDHNGGSVFEVSDNRIIAGFGDLPGNHALAACQVALALRELITRESHAVARIRISIDTGTVITTPPRIMTATAENELRGPPVTTVKSTNQALRREMVVITERTQEAADDGLQTRRLKQKEVVGFAMGKQLLELTGVLSGDAIT